MKIVLDTNVLVSALLNPNGVPAGILSLIINGKIQLLYDNRIMNEYEDVLNRDTFQFDSEAISDLLEFLKSEGEYVSAEPISLQLPDDGDRPVYEVGNTGNAAAIVTGNRSHYPDEARIQSPSDFVKRYQEANRTD